MQAPEAMQAENNQQSEIMGSNSKTPSKEIGINRLSLELSLFAGTLMLMLWIDFNFVMELMFLFLKIPLLIRLQM